MHRSPISITPAQPRSDRKSPPRNPLQPPPTAYPSTNFNTEAKRVNSLAPSLVNGKHYIPCTCRGAPRRIQTKHPQGRFASLLQSSTGTAKIRAMHAPSARPPGGAHCAPTSTRTSQYVQSCGEPLSANFLAPLHLPPRPATHEMEQRVYCCASSGGMPCRQPFLRPSQPVPAALIGRPANRHRRSRPLVAHRSAAGPTAASCWTSPPACAVMAAVPPDPPPHLPHLHLQQRSTPCRARVVVRS